MGNISDKLTYLLATKEAIKDAIVAKGGTVANETPFRGYAECISELPTGGGGGEEIPAEMLKITGTGSYRFYMGGWDSFIEYFGNRITTENLQTTSNMFNNCQKLEEIPFELNYITASANAGIDLNNMFYQCFKLKQIPKFNNCKPSAMNSIFNGCSAIQAYPEDIDEWFDWSYIDNLTSTSYGSMANIFTGNRSLRKLPIKMLQHGNPQGPYTASIYYYLCNNCYLLDEIKDIPFPHYKSTWTSNTFSSAFAACYRAKDITFALQEDGTPYTAKWKSQTITLTSLIGYTGTESNVTGYGISKDKKVTNDATYQALKNDPDWFTTDVNYSRYNHDSAVNTINSLPDTSAYLATAGGTNTIKFNKNSGAKTDGGAISNLTAEEIAVATAKGWTVTLS